MTRSGLPASSWKKKNNKEFQYKDKKSQLGPCTQVIVKQNKQIKATCKGAGVTLVPPLVEPIEVTLQMGAQAYCAGASGKAVKKNKNGQFQAKKGAVPATCP